MPSHTNLKEIASWKKFYENDLPTVVMDIIQSVDPPAMIILDGDLGAGKTTFTKNFVKVYRDSTNERPTESLGNDDVTSPTYSLINEIGPIAHADFYRIEDLDELVHMEIDLYFEEKDYFFVEWGRKYVDFLSAHIPDKWSFFMAEISTNEAKEPAHQPSRNLVLRQFLD